MAGFHYLDILIILGYFLFLVFIGVWSSRKIKRTSDFFIGGRRFGKFMMIILTFGTGTHTDQAIGVVSKCYQVGLAGIWYQFLWLINTPFYWIMAPIVRRLRVVNTADYYRKRYNQNVAMLYAVLAIVICMLNMGMILLGSGRIIEAISDHYISFPVAVLGVTVLFLSYGLTGGLIAAVITDVLQGVLTIVLSFILLPFALLRVGGFSGLHEKLSGAPHDMFSMTTPGEITIFFIIMVSFNSLLNWPNQPYSIMASTACKTEMESRVGVTYGNFIKRFCTVAWAFTGLCCIALFPNLTNPDHAFGVAARNLLPIGLVGLLFASVLAAAQSTCDAIMVSAASIFTRNIYKVYFAREKSDRHYLMVGRIVSLFVVAGSLAFAFLLPGIVAALELFWKIPALMGVSFWIGIFWRRANPATVWTSFIASFAVFAACEMDLFIGYEVSLPWQMVSYIIAGLLGAVIASLATKPQSKEHLDRFYDEFKKPVDKLEHLASDNL